LKLGLDTSVVVRLLIGLPEDQALVAKGRLARATDRGEPIVVTDLAVAEAYFALRHHYGVPEREARAAMVQFLDSGVATSDPPDLGKIVARAPKGVGFVDQLIHVRHRSAGATTLTFDTDLARLEGAERLR